MGAKVVNHEDGSSFNIRAKQVINATGVWTDETQAMVTDRGQLKVRASKGIHLVVPRGPLPVHGGPDPADRKVRAVRHSLGPALDHRHHRH